MELRKFENMNNNDVIRMHKHENRDRLCYCCDTLQEKPEDLISYNLNENFDIQLCHKCNKLIKQEWLESDNCDNDILDFIQTFPVENQEYMLNDTDWYPLEREDWIAMTKGLWTDDEYTEAGRYSPRQTKAYIERFPTCQHPINIEYENGNKGCCCVFGAVGSFGQNIRSKTDISPQCYKCEHYKQRTKPIETMSNEQYRMYSDYYIGKLNYLKYKDIFEK